MSDQLREAEGRLLRIAADTDTGLDVERLAAAMHPTWFEDIPERPDGFSPKDWALMRYDVNRRQDQARREAADVLARLEKS